MEEQADRPVGGGNLDGQYRAASDRMLDALERLRSTETSKRHVEVGGQQFVRLAEEAVELARLVTQWTEVQLELAREASAALARGQISGTALHDIPVRPIDRILADWREAEFRLRRAEAGSPDADQAAGDIDRLREEYRAAHAVRVARP